MNDNPKDQKCKYCGAEVPEGLDKCPIGISSFIVTDIRHPDCYDRELVQLREKYEKAINENANVMLRNADLWAENVKWREFVSGLRIDFGNIDTGDYADGTHWQLSQVIDARLHIRDLTIDEPTKADG